MKVIVGLGNPGSQYVQTRHNAGWLFLDYLGEKLGAPAFSAQKKFSAEISKTSAGLLLVKPQTFMNNSGLAVRQICDFYDLDPAADLVVAFDDLDLNLGTFKIQTATGPKDHNGLNSIYQHLGTQDFTHLRLGTDAREGERLIPPADYVLQKFPPEQFTLLQVTFQDAFAQII